MIEVIENFNYLYALSILTKSYLSFYFVLSALREECSIVRLITSSLILVVYQLIRTHLEAPTVLLDVLINIIAILVVKRDFTLISFVKTTSLYALVLLLGSIVEFMLIYYVDPNETLLSLIVCTSILISAFMVKLITKLVSEPKKRRLTYIVELISATNRLKTRAFWDSGNLLYYKGVPVIMISSRIANKLKLKNSLKIPLATASGHTVLDGGELGIKIFSDKKTHKLLEVRYCVSDTIVTRGYEVLLHKEMEVV